MAATELKETAADLDQLCINTIRTLSMDAVQAANSGHPGTPMALAPVAYKLWQDVLRFDPEDPIWPNRDRFVLSVGHASMLLYSMLHLTGTKSVSKGYEDPGEMPSVTLDDIKHFRQLGSKTPGHPEYRWTSGVETTTGPLGQGVATSVGMAIAGKWLATRYNKDGVRPVRLQHVYAMCGDGDMMEGVSSEAASLAGHLKLDNLCWIYDNNTDHHRGPHRARLQRRRGHPVHRLRLERHSASATRMTWTACSTGRSTTSRRRPGTGRPSSSSTAIIGYGSPHKAGHPRRPRRAAGRGRNPPHQAEVLRLARGRQVPRARTASTSTSTQGVGARGKQLRDAWFEKDRHLRDRISGAGQGAVPRCSTASCPPAGTWACPPSRPTRRAWPAVTPRQKVLNGLAQHVPWLIGGSADLAPSTKTRLTFEGAGDFEARQLRRAGTSTSASASTSWPPSSTAWPW